MSKPISCVSVHLYTLKYPHTSQHTHLIFFIDIWHWNCCVGICRHLLDRCNCFFWLQLESVTTQTAGDIHLQCISAWKRVLQERIYCMWSQQLTNLFLCGGGFLGGPSRWLSSHCDCCCKSHKSEREGESGTSFNELSTSCSETQSEASSPQGTVIRGPVSRRANIQTLDRPLPKGQVHMLQQAEMRRKTDMLRVRTFGVREREAAKRKANKEKMTPEQELEKCIQDFRRIRIPDRFPERKYMWQSELLRKYRL